MSGGDTGQEIALFGRTNHDDFPAHIRAKIHKVAKIFCRATTDGVNCFARDGARGKTRMFAPSHGVNEDAATGSAAGPLALHLARHGRIAFGEEIEKFDPDFSKVLVRYNPGGDAAMNERQTAKLARLGDWLHEHDRRFLFELLVPAEEHQLESVGGSADRYDAELRPQLMIDAILALRAAWPTRA